MRLLVFRHLWGVREPWEQCLPRFAAAGYRGIETHLPEPDRAAEFARLLAGHDLRYIAMAFTAGDSPADHARSLDEQVARALDTPATQVTVHSGRDAFTDEQAIEYFDRALEIEARRGLPLAHETHRGRILYNPWIAARLLARFEALRLCCDYSHWVAVCERLIDDDDLLRRCASRCVHLHARVGHEQGPQVPHPAAPEHRRHLEAHERWWDMIWDAQEQAGLAETTLTPEFGPPGYLPTLPFTSAPVADLEQIVDWQAARQTERFARRCGAA